MKQKLLLKTMLLLCAIIVGGASSLWGQVTIWSEDFSGYSKDDKPSGTITFPHTGTTINSSSGTLSYSCSNGTGTDATTTQIWDESTGGGTKPELLVGKTGSSSTEVANPVGGTFTAVIPLDNIEGTLTLTYYQNKQKLSVSSPTTGVSGGQNIKPGSVGQQTTTFTGITKDMTSITIVFQTTTNNNVRLDNIVLTGNKASNIAAPTIDVEGGFFTATQEVTITTNEDGGTTYYTLDGTSPTNESTPYTGAISISTNTTLKAVTYKGNEHSAVVSATYNFVEDGVFDFVNVCGAGYYYGSGVTPTSDGNTYIQEEKTWTAGNVTMVTDGKYRLWSDKTLRFYSNNPASSATFSVPDGYVITKIVSAGGNFTTKDKGALNGATWSGVAQSVKLSTGSSSVTFNSITVTYTPAITVTLASACTDGELYYGTYSNSNAFVVPDDLVVSEISVVDGELLVEDYATGAIVPANTGVMVSSDTSGGHTIGLTTDTGTSVLGDDNMLKPSGDAGITKDGMETGMDIDNTLFYRLTMHDGTKLGFWWGAAEGAAFGLAANKAYLAVPKSAFNTSAPAMGFGFGDDETTGIGATLTDTVNDNVIYDLSGRRVAQPTKGLYIMNGKKVIIK